MSTQTTVPAPTIFGREPAMLLGLISAVIALASALIFHFDMTQQGAINAVVSGVLGLVVAFKVGGGTWAAVLTALFQSGIACVLAFGFALSGEIQSGIMFVVVAAVSYATRQIVTAPQPAALPGSSVLA